ncbi:hypothetical protein ABZS76_32985 [Streptomyces sp. NPDC005562]|uniref:hypothetical protein n=1 Tax=Streptomyces sp. NPDC005562 TaxID=3154890 RepID=UPI0033B34120
MSDYAVSDEEKRRIAEGFLKAHPYLKSRWGWHYGDRQWPQFEDDKDARRGESARWMVQITDPLGGAFVIDAAVVTDGLRYSVYEDTDLEASSISGWVLLQTEQERVAQPLPEWGPSRICQLGLFKGSDKRFPYQGHSYLSKDFQNRKENLSGFLGGEEDGS